MVLCVSGKLYCEDTGFSAEAEYNYTESGYIYACTGQDGRGYLLQTLYSLELHNVVYPEISFTVTYPVPYFVYDDVNNVLVNVTWMLCNIRNNIENVRDVLDHCQVIGYPDTLAQSLVSVISLMETQISKIEICSGQYRKSCKDYGISSGIRYIFEIERIYWQLYTNVLSGEDAGLWNVFTSRM